MVIYGRAIVRARRLFRHIREGTLGERIDWEIEKWKARTTISREQRSAERKRLRWNKIKGKKGYIDTKVEGGASLRLYTDSTLGELIYCQGFEQDERTFLWCYLRPGDVFVDVGANIGLFTVIAARRVGTFGHVYAFEPAALPRVRLEENVRLNSFNNVSIQSLALSDREEWLEIAVPSDGHDAWSSLARPIAGTSIALERAETATWDSLVERNILSVPRMMKIDVEGWERRVLDGARRTLLAENAPLLQVEFTDAAAEAAGSTCRALYQRLIDFGYTVCRYDRRSNRLERDEIRDAYPYVNLYATKNIHKENFRLQHPVAR